MSIFKLAHRNNIAKIKKLSKLTGVKKNKEIHSPRQILKQETTNFPHKVEPTARLG